MSTDDRHVRSTSPNLDVHTIPNFADFLRDEVKKFYQLHIAQPNLLACTVCGPLVDDGSGHNAHLCDDPKHRPHKEMFMVHTLFPIVFCKKYEPMEGSDVPVHLVEATAELFNQVATVFQVYGITVPACHMHLTHDKGVSHMLALYFYANTTAQYLNAMYDTAAFCEDSSSVVPQDTADWRSLIGRINYIKTNIPLHRPEPKPEREVSMGKLIPFHLPGRGQA